MPFTVSELFTVEKGVTLTLTFRIGQGQIPIYIGRGGRFGRGVSLYRYRSQLFVRFVGMILTADRAVFRDLILGL